MIWSFSSYRQFLKCPRQWFYKNIFANSVTKDPLRKEAFYLSQAKSISAWRGDVVDKSISNFILKKIVNKRQVDGNEAVEYARSLCRKQFDFAKTKQYRNGLTKKVVGDGYCVLYSFEYDIAVSNDELKTAWDEIECAIMNFLGNQDLNAQLSEASILISQRPLMFSINGVRVRGVPDLIAFYKDEPPRIFDWKVHAFGTKTYGQQLSVYALALARSNRHSDFPINAQYKAEEIKVSEYQLLLNVMRDYEFDVESTTETEEFIAESILEMELEGANKKLQDTTSDDFQTTRFPENCQTCAFKKICWE